jgi:hypothetical protein
MMIYQSVIIGDILEERPHCEIFSDECFNFGNRRYDISSVMITILRCASLRLDILRRFIART